MWRNSLLALAIVFAGCSGQTTKDTGTTDNAGDDDDDDTTGGHSGGGFGGDFMGDPVAVGVEVDGILLSDGTMTYYSYGGNDYQPSMFLTFTSLNYFADSTSIAQQNDSCIAYGTWSPTPLVKPDQIDVSDGATLNWSAELPMNLEYSDCQTKLDPAVWGDQGADLLNAFFGARFGLGLGPMNQTFLDDWFGDVSTTQYPEFFDFMNQSALVEYVAINDQDGNFVGRPWNYAALYQWDPDTHELVSDANGYLVPLTVNGIASGGDLPEGYLSSNALWYADFCQAVSGQTDPEQNCLDLTNLQSGAR